MHVRSRTRRLALVQEGERGGAVGSAGGQAREFLRVGHHAVTRRVEREVLDRLAFERHDSGHGLRRTSVAAISAGRRPCTAPPLLALAVPATGAVHRTRNVREDKHLARHRRHVRWRISIASCSASRTSAGTPAATFVRPSSTGTETRVPRQFAVARRARRQSSASFRAFEPRRDARTYSGSSASSATRRSGRSPPFGLLRGNEVSNSNGTSGTGFSGFAFRLNFSYCRTISGNAGRVRGRSSSRRVPARRSAGLG